MRKLLGIVRRFIRSEAGPTAVEYAIMLAFIILVCVAAITFLGQRTAQAFEKGEQALP